MSTDEKHHSYTRWLNFASLECDVSRDDIRAIATFVSLFTKYRVSKHDSAVMLARMCQAICNKDPARRDKLVRAVVWVSNNIPVPDPSPDEGED